MSEVLLRLIQLPETVQTKISSIYGALDKFYATVYLIAKNEHILQEEKPAQWEDRMKVIHVYQGDNTIYTGRIGTSGQRYSG